MKKRQQGFTLYELFVALAIIGAMYHLAYPAWNFFVEMPRRTEAINVTTALVNKQKLYFMDAGTSRYAPDIATLRPNLPPGWACVSSSVCENEHWRVTMDTVTTAPLQPVAVNLGGIELANGEVFAVANPLVSIVIPTPPFFVIRGERINSHRAIPGFWADGLGKAEGMTLTQK